MVSTVYDDTVINSFIDTLGAIPTLFVSTQARPGLQTNLTLNVHYDG